MAPAGAGDRTAEAGEPSESAGPDVTRRILRDAPDVRVRQPIGLAVRRQPSTVGIEAGEPALRAHPQVAAGVDVQRVHERAQQGAAAPAVALELPHPPAPPVHELDTRRVREPQPPFVPSAASKIEPIPAPG